jgi:hypothetical protein
VACVREQPAGPRQLPVSLRPLDAFARFVALARFHGVEACVYQRLRDRDDVDAGAKELLRDAYLAALHVHVQARHALRDLHDAFDAAGVPWLVVKGAALAEVAYTRADLRSYADVDVVVPPPAFPSAVRALERAGHEVLDRNWRAIRDDMNGQVHVRLERGLVVDLHWNLVNHAHLRRTFPIDTASLFTHARPVEIGDVPVHTLSAADTLVHLALHTCLSGGDRLIWCKDIEQVLLHDAAPWSEVGERAAQWNATVALATVVEVTQTTLGVPIARDAPRLAPAWWRVVVRATDRLAPVERATGSTSIAQVLRRAVRGSEGETLWNGARHVGRWVAGSARLVPSSAANAPDDPGSVLYPAGDAADREAYFEAVTAAR